ncbi:hypothetical protein SCHPADRAFT_994781 [Schizopora paradoxa]|uniref:Uncharacterized protein n=1 Tax=Schizopora paradoxa TaxID=27342 RepID=A0A0H2SIT1_9AGAM|nr:hypothetical protein SCHPADRAFT_994781 [Schizopora paradoxa]
MSCRTALNLQARRPYDDGSSTVTAHAKKLSKPKSSGNRRSTSSSGKTQAKSENDAQPKLHDKQTRSRRSSAKGAKLTERWNMLSKIIRVQKANIEVEEREEFSDSGYGSASDDKDDRSDSGQSSAGSSSHQRPQDEYYSQHAHSPKIPSPLTGLSSAVYADPPRYLYGNHGLSQSSLFYKRHLWARRKHAWDEYEYHLEAWRAVACAEAAYGGIVPPDVPQYEPQAPPQPQTRCRTDSISVPPLPPTCPSPMPTQVENKSAATYPRVGDLSSLRDPFLLSVDSWFCDLPLWTLSQLTWIYDLNHRLACGEPTGLTRSKIKESFKQEAPEDIYIDNDGLPDVSVCSTETTSSDVTLVDITLKEQSRSPGEGAKESPQETVYWTPVMTPSEEIHHQIEVTRSERTSYPRAWEVSWFSRWEVLYHQLRLAALFATDTDFQESPSLDLIKEASRVLLTSGRVLYNPDAEHYVEEESEGSSESSSREVEVNTEEPEDTFQEEPPAGDSWPRPGASVDPLVMFAMAKLPFSDESIICDTEDCTKDAGAFLSADDDCTLIHPLEHLTLRC